MERPRCAKSAGTSELSHAISSTRLRIAGSSFSGLLTRVLTGHVTISSIGYGRINDDLIGSGEAQERSIVGETPNLAARLQGIAEPNMVVICDSTRRLLGNLFELEDLGHEFHAEPKGILCRLILGEPPGKFELGIDLK